MIVQQQVRLSPPGIGDPPLLAGSTDLTGADLPDLYRRLFGWSVKRLGDGSLTLVLENGLCAIVIPKSISARLLRNLDKAECHGPVLDLATPHGARLVILAEADGVVPPADVLGKNVEVLHSGALVPLSSFRGVQVGWFRPPDPCNRWLPSLGAVLAMVQSCLW